jgi:AAA domain
MTIHDSKQPPLLPKSSAARAKDNAILNQIMSTTYTDLALHPEERRAALDAARGARVELALSGQRHLTEEMAERWAASAIYEDLEPLFGGSPSWMVKFEFNPFFEADGGVDWSPDFYEPKDPESLPPRECFYGGHYYPKELVATVAPGGRGKSLLSHAESLAMISGKPLLGELPSRQLKVLMMNYEDHQDELERRFEAARKHYGVSKEEVRGRIIIESVKADVMCFAKETDEGVQIADTVVDHLREVIERSKIDVVIIDPWVSAHSVGHNDIHKIQPIVTMFKDLADDTGACIELVIHPRKSPGEQPLDEQDIIGSVGLPNKTRDVRVLNTMSAAEATKYGIEPWAISDYFRVDNPKHTHKRSSRPVWRQKISVSLGNGAGLILATDVGVVVPWSPPTAESLAAGLEPGEVSAIKDAIAGGLDREDSQAEKWAGKAVAQSLGLNVENKADKAKAKATLAGLIKGGHLKKETRDDGKSRPRKHVVSA